MIRLRGWIDRGLEHRWLGLGVLFLLVLVLAFLAIHAHPGETDEGALHFGIALSFTFAVGVALLRAGRALGVKAWASSEFCSAGEQELLGPPANAPPGETFSSGTSPLRR